MTQTLKKGNEVSFPILRYVRERDIDLLLLGEIFIHTGFEKLFLELIQKPEYTLDSISHSVISSGLGETDILVVFKNKNKKLYLLIENKIDALFQPSQYERYEERAEEFRKEGHEAYVILVAPEKYLRNAKKFKTRISYEQIRKYFADKKDARNRYKTKLLGLAIEGKVQVETDEKVTSLWSDYYSYIQENIPELKMNDPGGKPSNSSFVYFKPRWIPKNTKLVHKMNKGYLDFQLSGQAKNSDTFLTEYSKELKNGIDIVIANKSLAFRIELTPLSLQKSLNEQMEVMEELSKKYKILRNWIIKHYEK